MSAASFQLVPQPFYSSKSSSIQTDKDKTAEILRLAQILRGVEGVQWTSD